MTKKPRQRLVGRRRWAKVTRFLENAMVNGGSERIRTQAAMRLVDLLTLREHARLQSYDGTRSRSETRKQETRTQRQSTMRRLVRRERKRMQGR